MEIVSSLANTNRMHDETEQRLAHLSAMSAPQSHTLLVAYADRRHILPYRITLQVIARQGSLSAGLYERRWWTRKQSTRYLAIEEALTNTFAESFGQKATVTRSR
jgi:hypothetical protein